MAKRGASSDLNQDNWNADEENEEAGSFTQLSPAELKNRVIRKARRRITGSSESSPMGKSPFASFSGFSTSSSTITLAQLKANNSTYSNSLFSSLQKKEIENVNGNSKTESKIDQVSGDSCDKSLKAVASTSKPQEKKVRPIEYYKQLQSLNESVIKWMQLHIEKNACCDFTPVFNDYKKHLDTLNVTYPVVSRNSPPPTNNSEEFKKPEVSKELQKKTSSASPQAKSYVQQKDETDYGAHFKSNTTNTSTFSFGIQSTPTSTSYGLSTNPTSSSQEGTEKNVFPGFSFLSKGNQLISDKPFSFASKPVEMSSTAGEEEEGEYVPPKNDFTAVSEEDAIYSKRCKLFFKKDDSYADRGVGTLYLKKLEGKTQLLVRADTSLGNILLNIVLSASLPMSRTGKNNVLLVCIPNPPVDAKTSDTQEAIPMLIRVKTSEDADELLETLNKHKS